MKMSMDRFPVGLEMDVSFPNFQVSLTLLSATQLRFQIEEGPFARAEIVDIHVVPLGNSIFAVSWQEKDGATVTNVQDYDRGLIYSCATLPGGQFLRSGHWHRYLRIEPSNDYVPAAIVSPAFTTVSP